MTLSFQKFCLPKCSSMNYKLNSSPLLSVKYQVFLSCCTKWYIKKNSKFTASSLCQLQSYTDVGHLAAYSHRHFQQLGNMSQKVARFRAPLLLSRPPWLHDFEHSALVDSREKPTKFALMLTSPKIFYLHMIFQRIHKIEMYITFWTSSWKRSSIFNGAGCSICPCKI